MITLWDGYAIDADEYQFILGKPTMRKRKDGTEEQYMAIPTYHPRLGSALGRFYNIKVRESIRDNQYTLSQAVAQASQIEERIRSLAGLPSLEGAQT